jgi:hypothetical protein
LALIDQVRTVRIGANGIGVQRRRDITTDKRSAARRSGQFISIIN